MFFSGDSRCKLFQAESKMKTLVVSPWILVMLGALIQGSCALQCYTCNSNFGGHCDDPIETTHRDVEKKTCDSEHRCMSFKGTSKSQNIVTYLSCCSRVVTQYVGILLPVDSTLCCKKVGLYHANFNDNFTQPAMMARYWRPTRVCLFVCHTPILYQNG